MNTRTPPHTAAVLTLSASAHYITPTGRWCRWVPPPDWMAQRRNGELFLYHHADGRRAADRPNSEGFFLTPANLGIVRRITA